MGCMCPTPSRAACDRETRICARCLSCPQSKSTKRRELESARPGSEVHRRARARPGTRSGERASPAFNPRKPNAASAPKGPFSPIKRELRSALLVHAPALQVHVHAFGALASDPTFAMARSVMCVYAAPYASSNLTALMAQAYLEVESGIEAAGEAASAQQNSQQLVIRQAFYARDAVVDILKCLRIE